MGFTDAIYPMTENINYHPSQYSDQVLRINEPVKNVYLEKPLQTLHGWEVKTFKQIFKQGRN